MEGSEVEHTSSVASAGRPSGTRARIQRVALELFLEQGYDKTSLREISERLGVTKAALYYHFKSKEDIVASLVADSAERLEELVEWAREQPKTTEARKQIVSRYVTVSAGGRDVMRFFQENQSALKDLKTGEAMREKMMALLDVISDPGDTVVDQLRARLSLFTINFSRFAASGIDATPEVLEAAATQIANDLLDASESHRDTAASKKRAG